MLAKEKKLCRREREKLMQRGEIMAAALELFSKNGYSNVSMHEIAKSAEFAVGTLYKFFKNKEDLYKALVSEQSCKFHNILVKALDEPKQDLEKLRNYIRVKGEIFSANATMIRMYYAELEGARLNLMAGLGSAVKKRHNQLLEKLEMIFSRGMKAKRFKKIAEPFQLALALDHIINAFLFTWLDEPEKHPYPDNPDVILNILLRGLV